MAQFSEGEFSVFLTSSGTVLIFLLAVDWAVCTYIHNPPCFPLNSELCADTEGGSEEQTPTNVVIA